MRSSAWITPSNLPTTVIFLSFSVIMARKGYVFSRNAWDTEIQWKKNKTTLTKEHSSTLHFPSVPQKAHFILQDLKDDQKHKHMLIRVSVQAPQSLVCPGLANANKLTSVSFGSAGGTSPEEHPGVNKVQNFLCAKSVALREREKTNMGAQHVGKSTFRESKLHKEVLGLTDRTHQYPDDHLRGDKPTETEAHAWRHLMPAQRTHVCTVFTYQLSVILLLMASVVCFLKSGLLWNAITTILLTAYYFTMDF